MKKFIAIVMCMALAISCVACAKSETPAKAEAQTETTTQAPTEAPTQAETVAPTEAETEPAAEAQAPKWRDLKAVDSPKNLHPFVKNIGEGGQTEENFTVFNMSYPEIRLSEEEAKAYPNLETAIREDLNNYLDMTAEEDRQRINESFDPSMLQDEYFNGLSIEGSAGILRADENFFSVVISKNVWLGGQHPSTARICFNYSTQDGSLIVPSDIFTSKADLIAVLKEKLKAIPDVEYFNLDEDLEMYDFEHGPMAGNIAFSMGITDDGIVFFFNEYELAPYACGEQIITLSYKDYASIINPDFAKVPASFAHPFLPNVEIPTAAGKLVAGCEYDQYGTVSKIKLSVDGNETGFETRTYKMRPVIVQKNDKTFVYILEDEDDDDEFIRIFDITGGTPKEVKRVETRYSLTGQEEEKHPICNARCWARSLERHAFTDPDYLILDKETAYVVGDDGVPVKK